MSADDITNLAIASLLIAWVAISAVVWVIADYTAIPLGAWFVLNVLALIAFGVWGVTR